MIELATLVSRQARYRGDTTAVVFEQHRLSYAQFWTRVARAGNLLRSLGIGKGDKVATVLANSLELLELYWAIPTIGAVLVPLSPLLMPAGLASLVRDSDAKCLVSQRSMLPVLGETRSSLPAHVLLTDGASGGFGDYRAACAMQSETLEPAACAADDLFNIMYTSGTTGMPKGIMHTHLVRAMYCFVMGAAFRMTPESVALHAGAIVFNGAFVTMMPTFWNGGRYVLMPQFDAPAMIETVARERVTHVMLVPAQIIALLGAPNFAVEKLASLECILSLGAPLLQEHKDRLNALLPNRFYELYGLTEGFITILDRTDAVRKSGSVGVPLPSSAMRSCARTAPNARHARSARSAGRARSGCRATTSAPTSPRRRSATAGCTRVTWGTSMRTAICTSSTA
jgi:acyl-CoA synthetase (AMP-forming)/AMP-acid ligase II